jgi:hypothetical protein
LVVRDGNYLFVKPVRNFTLFSIVKGSPGQGRSFNDQDPIYRATSVQMP